MKDHARIVSASQHAASLFLSVRPTRPEYELSTDELQVAVRIRLGLAPIPSERAGRVSTSFEAMNRLAGNQVGCAQRHNLVCKALIGLIREAGGSATSEPLVHQGASQHRGDIEANLSVISADTLVIDATVIAPTCASYVERSQTALGAARVAEQRKHEFYNSRHLIVGHKKLSVFALEAFGALGPGARALLEVVARQAEATRLMSYRSFLVHGKAVISAALQRGNRVLVHKAPRHFQ